MSVSRCTTHISLVNSKENFFAGKTANHFNDRCKLTNDKWVFNTICGYSVELSNFPKQKYIPPQIKFSDLEHHQIEAKLQRFLDCGIIARVHKTEPDEFISNIFTQSKRDGGIWVILNLKQFNERYVDHIHFKMETLRSAVDAMRPGCFFGLVDLVDAYYSIPLKISDRRFFRLYFDGIKYEITALIMGLGTSPRVFTKIMKPVFATLRAKCFISTAYIDDSCLQESTFDDCKQNIDTTVAPMDSLGLTIHLDKSVLIPTNLPLIYTMFRNHESAIVS